MLQKHEHMDGAALAGAARGAGGRAAGLTARGLRAPDPDTAAAEHDQRLGDRLANLRTAMPVLAQELLSARRHAAELKRENERLLSRIRDLQRLRSIRR